jgi:hypothetical protein
MRPIFIIPEQRFKDGEGNECLTVLREDFEKYINDAYDSGFQDGRNSSSWNPNVIRVPNSPDWDKWTITTATNAVKEPI